MVESDGLENRCGRKLIQGSNPCLSVLFIPMTTHIKSHRQSLTISLILGLTFLAYSPVLFHEFVNLDDTNHIVQNPQIRSLSPENLGKIFASSVQKTYIPLTIFSFAVEYHFVGLNPFLYHLNNVLLHLLVVFLVFRLGMALGLSEKGACVAAFIFGLHPMHVESVAWVTERKDVLYSAFYLGAVLSYLSFLRTKKQGDYGISLLLGFLSMLAKPMALSLPLILLLCDWFTKGSLKKEDWLNKVPYGLFIVPLALVTYSMSADLVAKSAGSSPLFRFWAAAFYLKKFLWPAVLVPHYVPPLPPSIFRFEYWSSVLVIGASVLAFWKWPQKWLRFAFLWYILSIFFLLNFDHPRFMQMVADRYMYLPSAGFCFLAGYTVEKIREGRYFSSAAGKRAVFICLIGAALFLSIKTFLQAGIWKNSLALWNYTIARSPESFLAFNNRGRVYEHRRQFDLAMADYKEAVRINPTYAKTHKNMGMIYEGMGDIEAAIEAYSKAIQINPNFSGAYNNRGLLLQKKGDHVAALSDFDRAIAADPGYLLGYVNRGSLFMTMGDFQAALEDLDRAVSLEPRRLDLYLGRAACYLNLNLFNKALQECRLAVKLSNSHPVALEACSKIQAEIEKGGKVPVKPQVLRVPERPAKPIKEEPMDAFKTELDHSIGDRDD